MLFLFTDPTGGADIAGEREKNGMARHDYSCKKCESKFELDIYVTEVMKDCSDKLECPECGSKDIVKKYKAPGLTRSRDLIPPSTFFKGNH